MRKPQHKRNGKSLVEMLVVMAMLSTLLVIGGRTLFLLMKAERTGGQSLVAATTLSRWSHIFRADVHAATKSQLINPQNSGKQRLQLTLPDSVTVQYIPKNDRILRVKQRDGVLESKDAYHLSRGKNLFTIDENQMVTHIHRRTASKFPASKNGKLPVKEFRIQAATGRNRRYVKQSE